MVVDSYVAQATFSILVSSHVIGKGYPLYSHHRHTARAVSTAAPPTCCLQGAANKKEAVLKEGWSKRETS